MEASRQIMWNIGNHLFLDLATLLAATSLVAGLVFRVTTWRHGVAGRPGVKRWGRLATALRGIFNQRGMIRGRIYLIMHRSMFYGMLVLAVGSAQVALELHFGIALPRGASYLARTLILELAGAAVLLGITLSAYKRYILKPGRLESRFSDAATLSLLAAIVLTGFLVKGARIYATSAPWAFWSPIGDAVAWVVSKLIAPAESGSFHAALWYMHATLAFAFIMLLPWTKLLHLLAVPLQLHLAETWADRAALALPQSGSAPATGRLSDCTRKQNLEPDACLECGRCKKLCSIYQGGEPVAPITLMKNLKSLLHRRSWSSPLVGGVISGTALWSCTACRSCEARCPMNGEHSSRIINIRRGQLGKDRLPGFVSRLFATQEASLALTVLPKSSPGPGSDLYLWPGCQESKDAAPATVDLLVGILKRAGLSAARLEPPACCGGQLRRLGNEALFQRAALANIEYLKAFQGKTIVTACPHCFNTLNNEYPQLGGSIKVMHHSQYLAGLLEEGKLSPAQGLSCKAVFHDPCFLGRYHQEFSTPRKLIAFASDITLLEMKHNRQKSFCCGSGGGSVDPAAARLNGRERVRQAVKEGAEAVITCCSYCRETLAAAALEEYPGKQLKVLDVAQIFESEGTHETIAG